jgi:hypothetical protein
VRRVCRNLLKTTNTIVAFSSSKRRAEQLKDGFPLASIIGSNKNLGYNTPAILINSVSALSLARVF